MIQQTYRVVISSDGDVITVRASSVEVQGNAIVFYGQDASDVVAIFTLDALLFVTKADPAADDA